MRKFFIITLSVSLLFGIVFSQSRCDKCLVVNSELVLPTAGCAAPGLGCSWKVVADNDERILFISGTTYSGSLDDNGQVFIYNDPSGNDIPQKLDESGVHSLSDFALIKFSPNGPTGQIVIKIQKATKCDPINTLFACSRPVDAISCYCITRNMLSWDEMTSKCQLHDMELVSIETKNEDQALWATWANYEDVWTSLQLSNNPNNVWVWNSTGNEPGNYDNWCIANPDYSNTNNRCMKQWSKKAFCWANDDCTKSLKGVCEKQP